MDINGDMIRGHIDTIILLSLIDGDKDSNEIRKSIEIQRKTRHVLQCYATSCKTKYDKRISFEFR